MTLLNELQQQTLRDLSNVHPGNTYAQENKALEAYLKDLREQYPECFHRTKDDLSTRVFFDAPTSGHLPHARSVRPRDKSPYLITPAKG